MVRLDWRDRLRALPSQTQALVEMLGLTAADVDAAAWVVMPDGRQRSGAAAVFAGVDQLLPRGTSVFSVMGRLPLLRQSSSALYRLVARNRHRLPGTPTCPIDRPAELSSDDAAELLRRRQTALSS